ncbi:ABC transporter substrate-binding protein [Herbaspirillum sp. RTI4]|uniref:ABC transporter substrate-binding protein n=1 Tax=Herbaspirillum sp. RTI4 TaxID=3048640 RepID=UPI002AB5A33B|nr:ABC transporter substrate-binding protein [Herbaspirillum sp. RTI4]MDY7576824.1 ABC transporter substrate-binding protein [Herbaspirillum sp. RTI4]MEA9981420.1 ABC transporter substrate-binding protein [Herbaspirillum sp. RTI4]
MTLHLKKLTGALITLGVLAFAAPASAQISDGVVKIGLITDMSGVFSDISGKGHVEAIKMAIADFGGTLNGKKIELVFGDHFNKADVAASKAREWVDREGVDILMSGASSAADLAIAKVAQEKKKLFIVIATGSARLTNEDCNPYTMHYGYDTVAMAKSTGSAVVKQGGKSWYFLTADYAFGQSLEQDTSKVIKAAGGTVLGSVKHPLGASDFSSFVTQAQASKAQILGLANATADTINAIKAANEFGLTKTMKLAGLVMFVTDIHSLGLNLTQGMYLSDNWYWDQDAASRAWSRRYFDVMKKMPTGNQAAGYSATMQYLNAVKAVGSDDADRVIPQMKKTKINDMYLKNGYIRDDGRVMYDMYLMQVKTPAESKYPWDYVKIVAKIPADQAFTTKAESACTMWK